VVAFEHAIALTGGIATGKSTVCNLLKLHGFHIIDADEVAHQVLDASWQTIAKMFGKEYVQDGKVDRKALGRLVFGDHAKRKALEDLLHPKIKHTITQLAKREERFKVPYIIDIPLFFETKNYDISPVVVVYAPKEEQMRRLMKRERLSKEEALQRVSLQMDIEEKKRLADFVIDNSKDLKFLQQEVERFVEVIKERYAVG